MAAEDPGPELSSIAATTEELVRRVAAIAEASAAGEADRVASGTPGGLSVSQELFEAERALAEAERRLRGLADALRAR